MQTAFFLMAQFNARAVIPLEDVRREYFSHLEMDKFQRKLAIGEIALPIVRAEKSQKSAKGVHILDLAAYIDAARESARKECEQLTGIRR
jgi:Pyocin activator protein PrtN